MTEVIDGIKHADRVLRYLRVGVAVSQQNLDEALAAIDRGNEGVSGAADLGIAREVLAAGRNVMPSEQLCEQARSQIQHLRVMLDTYGERDVARPRG